MPQGRAPVPFGNRPTIGTAQTSVPRMLVSGRTPRTHVSPACAQAARRVKDGDNFVPRLRPVSRKPRARQSGPGLPANKMPLER